MRLAVVARNVELPSGLERAHDEEEGHTLAGVAPRVELGAGLDHRSGRFVGELVSLKVAALAVGDEGAGQKDPGEELLHAARITLDEQAGKCQPSVVKAKRKPPKPDPVLFVRVTEGELRGYEKASDEAGYRHLSEWVRQALKKYINGELDTR